MADLLRAINPLALYGLSALSIVLGFIALLKQKNYISKETGEPTEVEIPFGVKLKTRYPALLFAVVGFGLAYLTLKLEPTIWTISGHLKCESGRRVDWSKGELALIPRLVVTDVSPNGEFTITLPIESGETPESDIAAIKYTHNDDSIGSTELVPKDEFDKYRTNDPTSVLRQPVGNTRIYSRLLVKP